MCPPNRERSTLSWSHGSWLEVGFSSPDLRCGSGLQVGFGGGTCPGGAEGWHGQGDAQAVLAGAGPDTLEAAVAGRVGDRGPGVHWDRHRAGLVAQVTAHAAVSYTHLTLPTNREV